MQKVQENCYSLPKKALTWLTNMNSAYHEPSWRQKANCNFALSRQQHQSNQRALGGGGRYKLVQPPKTLVMSRSLNVSNRWPQTLLGREMCAEFRVGVLKLPEPAHTTDITHQSRFQAFSIVNDANTVTNIILTRLSLKVLSVDSSQEHHPRQLQPVQHLCTKQHHFHQTDIKSETFKLLHLSKAQGAGFKVFGCKYNCLLKYFFLGIAVYCGTQVH